MPVLVIGNSADDACTPSHTERLFEAVTHDRKTLHMVKGATHYYTGSGGSEHLKESVATISHFIESL